MANSDGGRRRNKLPVAARRRARRLLLQALYQWQLASTETTDTIAQFREENSESIDWEYFEQVLKDIPKQKDSLEQLFKDHLDRALDSLDPVERSLLYLGTFELSQRQDIPYRVVINECVELAKTFGAAESHKYINGVLDKLASELRPLEVGRKQPNSA